MNTRACAVATRSVEPFFVTSTIRARPDSLKCVKSAISLGESLCFAGSACDYRCRSEQESSRKGNAEEQRSRALVDVRSEEHTSELQSPDHIVCRLLIEKKKASSILVTHKSGLISFPTIVIY